MPETFEAAMRELQRRAEGGDQEALGELQRVNRELSAPIGQPEAPPAQEDPSPGFLQRLGGAYKQAAGVTLGPLFSEPQEELDRIARAAANPAGALQEAGQSLADNRLLSLGGSIAGAPLGPVGSAVGGTLGTAAEQLISTGQLNPQELGREGAINLAVDTVLPGIGRAGRGLIRTSRKAKKLFEEVAQTRLLATVDNFFRGVDPQRAGQSIQQLREKGINIKGYEFRRAFRNTLPEKQLKNLYRDIENLGLYPGESLVDISKTLNKVKNVTDASGTFSNVNRANDFDFGEIQNLRSKLQRMAFDTTDKQGVKKARLFKARDNLDNVIESSLSKPQNFADRELYKNALREYRLGKVHESSGQILKDITSSSKNRTSVEFSLGKFSDILKNPPRKYARIVKDIESIDGLKEVITRDLDALAATQPKLILDGIARNPAETLRAPGRAIRETYYGDQFFNSVGALFADVRGREYVKRIVETQEGRLTPQALTLGLQAIRRRAMPLEEQDGNN